MEFANRLKGAVTQVLLKALLEDGGYRLVPLGIEEVVRDVAALTEERYKALRLPYIMRELPDFFVSDQNLEKSWLVEVKYRREWNERTRAELRKQILPQVRDWGPIHLMVFLGTPDKPAGADLPSHWMGVLRLSVVDDKLWALDYEQKPLAEWASVNWGHFSRVQDVFAELGSKSKWEQQTLQKVRTLLPQLRALDVFT